MSMRDASALRFDFHPDHERVFVERLDPADVGAGAASQAFYNEQAGAWLAQRVGGCGP